jgi:Zn-dependent peptidase ImmA (M78 family)/transcriptional regulator with XRE-family HTH domain
MTGSFNHEMLSLARQYRGRSQAEVAADAGLDQGHYSRIERGLLNSPPTAGTLNSIASSLGFPVSFFEQGDEVSGLPLSIHDPFWRKRSSIAAGDLKRLHAELNIRVMQLRRLFEAVDFEPDLKLPKLDADETGGADKVAALVRRSWLIPDGPIANLSSYCERAGILVVHCDFVEKVDGVTMRLRGLPPVIFLNKRAPADRMRHSLAHELGHLVMHSIATDTMEDEADIFAGELLAPFSLVKKDLVGVRITLERLVQLKMYWRVSVASLLYKLGKYGFLTANQSEYLWKQLSARGWRVREPDETQFPPERPRLYEHVVDLHATDMGYGANDLMKMLRVNGDLLQTFYGIRPPNEDGPKLRLVK